MKPQEFHKYLQRDQRCYHCGEPYDLIPHHRANRGMGGSKLRNRPSNIISMCAAVNDLMESNATMAELAREFGWKLGQWENPLVKPVYDAVGGFWFRLDDDYKRIAI